MCCHPIYSGRQTCGGTSRGHRKRSNRISPPFFSGACLNFYREKGFSRPFTSSSVKSIFLYPTMSFSTCWACFFFVVRKNPSLSCACSIVSSIVQGFLSMLVFCVVYFGLPWEVLYLQDNVKTNRSRKNKTFLALLKGTVLY